MIINTHPDASIENINYLLKRKSSIENINYLPTTFDSISSQSEYIRKCVLDKKITVIPGIRDLIVDLKRIGNNLNQLTHRVSTGKVTVLGDNLKEIKDDLTVVWNSLSKVIGKVK